MTAVFIGTGVLASSLTLLAALLWRLWGWPDTAATGRPASPIRCSRRHRGAWTARTTRR
ncbi:hypothetical protein OHA04_27285 [Streptomyces sp. NBC_01590]|uniref:hypothetical protein n=1 Tax=Streptomyces sp. NBC_01590 TaxID=2975887 RepID=UPI00386A139A